MPLLKIEKLTEGLAGDWPGHLRDWDRTLRAANHPETTRYNYLLAAAQLGRYLGEHTPDPDAVDAAEDPTDVTKAHIEAFQAWVIETRSAVTALNKHKGLQQFFKYLVDEDEMDRSPMDRVKQPKTPRKLIPIIRDDDTKKILDSCKSTRFEDVRDEAIVRLYYNTGARLSEVANLRVYDVDLDKDWLHYRGKGSKDRRVRFGPKTGRAISRYLRTRNRHPGFSSPELWLALRGGQPLSANGIKLMLRRRGVRAGVEGVHAHRWRHNYAHEWKLAGGDSGDLMLLLGWTSDDMPRHYGASAAAERAQQVQVRMGIGERV
ncbi:site-specific tyrosine recombinase XerD [Dactylosporangium fulvum]|uniref:Tyrosine-type recombinase/integrase n=2 Tax=Dactylosporangium fulvum TaxID=53359 RepID=A0ABY5VUP3_9ACTN|nr:tyrosine-type recombinase/integrase [Dactylosporangium fulvum]UWP80534.1 tyrosine-type recombinase/integrase [Dactylosporangium fulvum]